MRAIRYQAPPPITDENLPVDVDPPWSAPSGRHLLVEIKLISVNPVDTEIRAGSFDR
ncbi:hypothetical protein IGS74_00415 [Aureimonas sp. OT7]|nr:hypothetical protein IGS74_00415 [Aureimonas sp. OT7]